MDGAADCAYESKAVKCDLGKYFKWRLKATISLLNIYLNQFAASDFHNRPLLNRVPETSLLNYFFNLYFYFKYKNVMDNTQVKGFKILNEK